MKRLSVLFGLIFSLAISTIMTTSTSYGQNHKIVEVAGVILSADSIHPVANAVITVVHKNRGVVANESGIYSLVIYPDDTLRFSSVGYRDAYFTLPKNTDKRYFNHVQLMVQDTFFLPEATVHALPTGRGFEYAFKYWPTMPSLEDLALERFTPDQLAILRATLPREGAENQALYQMNQAVDARYLGQVRTGTDLLNPFKWKEFIDAWKRGDFRKKY